MPLLFVTSNSNKLRELSALLQCPLKSLALDLQEIQATNLEKLVKHKLRQAYEHSPSPLIVEDSSLYFEAWNELPGPLVKWFLESLGLEGMVRALSAFENKSARAVCCLGYTADGENLHLFSGEIQGTVVAPRGSRHFGWDAIFQPNGYKQTFSEMSPEEKQQISHRALAAKQLLNFLTRQAERK